MQFRRLQSLSSIKGNHGHALLDSLVWHDRTKLDRTDRPIPPASLPATAADLVHRQRLFGPRLRNRLAPVAATGDRVVGGFAGGVAGNFHGRNVPGEHRLAAHRLSAATPFAGVRFARAGDRNCRNRRVVCRAVCQSDLCNQRRGGAAGDLLRGAVSAACLLPPALLIGATLPAIARWIEATPQGVSWLGFFYGGNIAGAVFGCLAAGFYLLRVHDMTAATYVAATINGAVSLIALGLAGLTPYHAPAQEAPASPALRQQAAGRYISRSGCPGCAR